MTPPPLRRHFIIFALLALSIAVTNSLPIQAFAKVSESDIYFYGQNNILFYNPNETTNFCTSGSGDCYIAGETRDEKLWSALRHVGFTPEQAAGIIGNIVHEGGTPTRQEDAYNFARNQNCHTQEGRAYDIYLDATDGAHHSGCMERIYSGYKAGNGVAGVGLGFIQWTSHGRRLGYLEKMQELGLLKYFEGDAYKTYGRYTDDQLRETIIEETGSDADYWALWCAAIKFIWTEMNGDYSGFFNNSAARDYAAWTASRYEVCASCFEGMSGYNSRIASAEEYYSRYKSGEFDAVENGSAPSATGSNNSTGKNVTIVGDSITAGSLAALSSVLPDAEITAQNSKHFTTDVSNNPSGLSILKSQAANNSLRDVIVYALGTNDTAISSADIRSVMDVAGSSRKIFFLTNYDIVNTAKYDNNNKEFAAAAATYDNVKLIDWKNALLTASGTPTDYIIDETATANYAVHPTAKGAELFAKTISDSINGVKASSTCGETIDGDYLIYYQSDAPWGSMPYGDCYVSPENPGTIGTSGCGPSSLAMIITAMTKQKITPDIIANKAVAAGHRVCGNGSSHAITHVAEEYGLAVTNYGWLSIEQVSQYLRQGVMFQVAGMGPSPFSNGGHFIAIRGITADGKWLIFDSAHKGEGTNEREWSPTEIYPYVGSDWRGVSRK